MPTVPTAPPAGPAAPEQDRPPKADQLHTHALQAEKHLEQLATGLAEVGADPQATEAVGQMADAMRKILSSLAKGGTGAPPEQPAQRPTMDSAADGMQSDLRAARGQ